MAMLDLGGRFRKYCIGLFFWGMASTLCGDLWLESRYIPKVLTPSTVKIADKS